MCPVRSEGQDTLEIVTSWHFLLTRAKLMTDVNPLKCGGGVEGIRENSMNPKDCLLELQIFTHTKKNYITTLSPKKKKNALRARLGAFPLHPLFQCP